VARQGVEDTETVIKQEHEDMRYAEKVGLTIRKHKKSFQETLNAIGRNLNNRAGFDDMENREVQDAYEDVTQLCKLSKDDKPGWAMATVSWTIQQRLDSALLKQMKNVELTQLGCGNVANCIQRRV